MDLSLSFVRLDNNKCTGYQATYELQDRLPGRSKGAGPTLEHHRRVVARDFDALTSDPAAESGGGFEDSDARRGREAAGKVEGGGEPGESAAKDSDVWGRHRSGEIGTPRFHRQASGTQEERVTWSTSRHVSI